MLVTRLPGFLAGVVALLSALQVNSSALKTKRVVVARACKREWGREYNGGKLGMMKSGREKRGRLELEREDNEEREIE